MPPGNVLQSGMADIRSRHLVERAIPVRPEGLKVAEG